MVPEVRQEEWRELYQAAADFMEHDSWDWMMEEDIFGVKNPETGEIGYCSTLSGVDGIPGFAVHSGTLGLEGFDRYLAAAAGPLDETDKADEEEENDFDSLQQLSGTNCLMLTYDDRKQLEEEDRQVIKSLGLKFRGAWPLFRSYLPGYVPWFLNSSQVRFLTLALRQAADVALRFRDDLMLLYAREENTHNLPTFSSHEKPGRVSFSFRLLTPDF